MSAVEACLWPTRCTPVALGFKGSEWGSKFGPVANFCKLAYFLDKVKALASSIFD